MNARRCFAVTLVALALLPRPAQADISDADRATARTLTLEGYESLDRKDYAIAADRFTRADALYHAPTVALGLAHAQVGLGKLVEAVATYSRIVHEGVPPGAPPAFVKAVDDARRELDLLMQRIPNVVIVVRGVDSPKVTIDGVDVPTAALGVKRPVDPGAHVVRAAATNAAPREASLTLLEGQVETVTLELTPVAPAAPALVPPSAASPPPPPPKPASPPLAPAGGGSSGEDGSTPRLLGVVALGVGAVGLGLGAVTGSMAMAKHGSLVEKCPEGRCLASQETALQSDVDAYHTLGTLSTVGFVVAGAGLATGAILLLTASSRPKREAAVLPALGPGYAGVTGRF